MVPGRFFCWLFSIASQYYLFGKKHAILDLALSVVMYGRIDERLGWILFRRRMKRLRCDRMKL